MPYKKIGCLNKRENNDMLIRKDKTVQRYIKRSSNLSKENQVKRYNQSKSELTPEVDNVTIYTIPKKEKTKLLKELSDSIRLLNIYFMENENKQYEKYNIREKEKNYGAKGNK